MLVTSILEIDAQKGLRRSPKNHQIATTFDTSVIRLTAGMGKLHQICSMKKTLLSVFAAIGTLIMAAQPAGNEFPDWTHTDINGVEHNLYTTLDEGKTVIIDIFTTWCPNCVNSLPNLHDLEEMYGPQGTGQLQLFSFERDASTTNEATWATTNNVTNPVFDNALETMNTWNTNYQPNFFVICPDRSFELVVGSIANNNPLPDLVLGCITSEIEKQSSAEFEILNNVVDNQLTFTVSDPAATYSIFGLNGQILESGMASSSRVVIDVNAFAEGIYLLQVQSNDDILTKKFIVR